MEGATQKRELSGEKAQRIVDAMGREVAEEPVKEEEKLPLVRLGRHDEDEDEDFPMSHNEALARVRETIKDLATDLDEVDR